VGGRDHLVYEGKLPGTPLLYSSVINPHIRKPRRCGAPGCRRSDWSRPCGLRPASFGGARNGSL